MRRRGSTITLTICIVLLCAGVNMTIKSYCPNIKQGTVVYKWIEPIKFNSHFFPVKDAKYCIKIEGYNIKGHLSVAGYDIPKEEWESIKLGESWRFKW